MDIGWGELLIILIVALLVVGPDKLPAYARKTARFVRNFQKVTTGLTSQISKAINLEDEEEIGRAHV
jgi:Tat protein translocase TatB subunit